jgi:ABC-2 type transport system permease protein
MFSRIWTLIIKELQGLLQTRQSRIVLIMPVLTQLALFPFAATLEVKNNTLAIVNEDNGRESIELIERFAQAEAFSKLLVLYSEEQIRYAIDNQEALLVVRFLPTFSRDLAAGRDSSLQVLLDGRRSNAGSIALNYIQSMVFAYSAERLAESQKVEVSTLIPRYTFNPNLEYKWHILPSLVAIITTIGTLIITALSVAREREQGTLDQLLVSPLTPGMIMIGKTIPAIVVAMVQATIILLASIFVYDVPFQGSFLLLYGCMLIYTISLAGFGLLISSVCATQQQAFLGVFSFVMPTNLLSGFATPIENMPIWLQYVNLANPLSHFVVIVKSIFLKNITAYALMKHLIPLLIITVCTMAAADWMFRRRTS